MILTAALLAGLMVKPPAIAAATPFILAPGANQFAVSHHSVCAIDISHHLFCWGDNSERTLGLKASVEFSQTPRRVGTGKWRSVHGYYTVCGIKWDYSVWCWGHPGKILTSGSLTPQLIPTRPAISVERIHPNIGMCIRDRKLQLWCRVDPDAFFVSGWRLISATPTQEAVYYEGEICFLTLSKIMKCWGKNLSGSFPTGAGTPTFVKKPRAVTGTYETLLGTPNRRLRCALDTQGVQRCWGNRQFRLNSLPARVPNDWFTAHGLPCSAELCVITPTKIEEVQWQTLWDDQCGLLTDGTIDCVHQVYQEDRDPKSGRTPPLIVTITDAFTEVLLGGSVGCGSMQDRTLWCWGLQDFSTDSVSGPRTFGRDESDYATSPVLVMRP